jgi:hypothetical protein
MRFAHKNCGGDVSAILLDIEPPERLYTCRTCYATRIIPEDVPLELDMPDNGLEDWRRILATMPPIETTPARE